MYQTSCYRNDRCKPFTVIHSWRVFQLDPTDPQRPRRQAEVHVFDAAKIMARFDRGDVDAAFLHEVVLARTHEVVLARAKWPEALADLTLMFSQQTGARKRQWCPNCAPTPKRAKTEAAGSRRRPGRPRTQAIFH